MSRRGLRPHRHLEGLSWPKPVLARPAPDLSALVRWARTEAAQRDWRLVIDSLRPVTQMMWASADREKRARFLRHLRPYWDVHRHRLAPAVAARIDALIASGRLRFRAGKILHASAGPATLILDSRARAQSTIATFQVSRAT